MRSAIVFLAAALANAQILISPDDAARQVRELQTKMRADPTQPTTQPFEAFKAEHERWFGQMQTVVEQFVVKQFNAEPRLTREQLRDLLNQVLEPWEGSGREPHVFRSPPNWAANETGSVVWAVVYRDDATLGVGGSRITIDSFVVDRGTATLAKRGGSEMSGHALNVYEMRSPSADQITVLLHGRVEWASGHELPARAILYGVSQSGVANLWDSKVLPGLEVSLTTDQTGFKVQHHDEAAHQLDWASPHTTVVDTYELGADGVLRVSTERP
jgi:hypothetical protein